MDKATAVRVFEADSANELEHDINEWMVDTTEHDGIVSVQMRVTHTADWNAYTALVHYVLP